MSEPKAEEAAERLRWAIKNRWLTPGATSRTIEGVSSRDLEALFIERDSLLKYKEAFEAMVEHSWYAYYWNPSSMWKVYDRDDDGFIAEMGKGATPLDAVMAAKKGLAAK